ncbi:MAG: tetratricopeptide repeat protein [Muribaculaceae bacterium]|nr:tetratricopeptide repeat protein [Muribaculaceae bacterium]
MKIKLFIASLLIAGAALSSMAQGYKDGIEYYKVGQLDNAKELIERNLTSASNKAEAYFYLGQIALKQNNAAEAKAAFDKGVAADANYPYNYVGQAQIALKNGEQPKALLETARKLSKKDAALETAIARAYYSVDPTKYAKDIDKCVKQARKWTEKKPQPESFIFEGDTYADKQDYGKAAGLYELAYTYDPDNIEARVKWANTYYFVNPQMALQHLEDLNAQRPNSALVQRQLAEKYYESNLGGKAAEKYGEYIKNPNHFNQDEVRYVQLLFFGEKYQESYDLATSLISKLDASDPNKFYMERMKLYNKVAQKDWHAAVAAGDEFFAMSKPATATYEVKDYTDYAQALQQVGQPAKAIEAFEKAVELNPKNVDLLRNLSDTYAEAKNYAKSASTYQKVIDSGDFKANDLYELGKCYYNLAVTTENASERDHAIVQGRKYLHEVNEKVPGNVRIVNQIARLERLTEGDKATGKAAPAYHELVKLLDSKDNKSDYASYYISAFNYLANAAMNNNDLETAKAYYKQWLEHDPENADLRKYVESFK